jgi:hypothetical protein
MPSTRSLFKKPRKSVKSARHMKDVPPVAAGAKGAFERGTSGWGRQTRTSSFGGPHVRFRRVQTLVREGSPLVKLRNSA